MTTTEEAEEMAEKLDVDARNMANGFNVNAIAAHHVAPAAAMLRDLAAERDRLREALENIARQKRTDELVTEFDVEYADFEGGFDECVNAARAALKGDSDG